MPSQPRYGYGVEDTTFKPQAFSPFAGLGVLEKTQAATVNARNAIQTYNQDLYDNEGRAQNRAERSVGHPYRLGVEKWQGQANVAEAQGNKNMQTQRALYYGSNYDTLDPMIGREFAFPDIGADGKPTGRMRSVSGLLPDNAHPTRLDSQAASMYQYGSNTPYLPPADATPLNPYGLGGEAAPAAATTAAVTNSTPAAAAQVMDTPGGAVRFGDFIAKPGVTPVAVDRVKRDIAMLENEHATALRDLEALRAIPDPGGDRSTRQGYLMEIQRAQDRVDDIFDRMTAARKSLSGLGTQPMPDFNNYGLPAELGQQMVPGSGVLRRDAMPQQGRRIVDVNPQMAPGSTAVAPPSHMPAHLVPGFKQLTSLYQEPAVRAINAPGGAEYAGFIAALESDFRPDATPGTSHAYGFTQMMPETFANLAKRFPWGKGKSPSELEAMRKNPKFQAIAEAALRVDNAATLITLAAKHPELKINPTDPFNLYAMHHFNPAVAQKMVLAYHRNRNVPVNTLFPATGENSWATVWNANKYLAPNNRPLTIGQVYGDWMFRAQRAGFYGGLPSGGGGMRGVAR